MKDTTEFLIKRRQGCIDSMDSNGSKMNDKSIRKSIRQRHAEAYQYAKATKEAIESELASRGIKL